MTKACLQSQRPIADVKLLLATKTVSPERIKIALDCDERLIAENKVQEIKQKHDALSPYNYEQHFIGHLQSNKIKDILNYNITCIHTIDRIGLVEKLDKRLSSEGQTMDILIQVNTSDEESKFGVHPDDAISFIKRVSQYNTLHIKGLMTIGLFSADKEVVRQCFIRLKDIQTQVKQLQLPRVEMNELSMGMSGDLEIAIQEGATIIRVGTAIFGERQYPDSYYWNESGNIQ